MDALLPAKAHVSRRFNVSPQRVLEAWLDARIAGRWLFARPDGEIVCAEIDPRAGGWFYIVERRNDKTFDHMGEYIELVRPQRLVFILFAAKYSLDFERITVELKQDGTGCELDLTHETKPETVVQLRRDWTYMLENLAKVLDNFAKILGGSPGAATRHAAELLEKPT